VKRNRPRPGWAAYSGDCLSAKTAIYTVGAWPGQIEKLVEQLTARNAYAGKFSSEERLIQAAEKGMITHLLVTQEGALNAPTIQKLRANKIEILTFRDAGKIL
jgi:hypothetical protein